MTLSERFGISEVALKKMCARVGIPTPERGYWTKKDAGKETFQAAFPLRPPGMDDQVEIGAGGNTCTTIGLMRIFLALFAPLRNRLQDSL
jgi:hypothetical protein